MNADTLAALLDFEAARQAVESHIPGWTPPEPRPPVTAEHEPWQAVAVAVDFLRRVTPRGYEPSIDEPAGLAHAMRAAWRSAVVAAYAAAGQPLDDEEAAELDRMTIGGMSDQLTYLADYQG